MPFVPITALYAGLFGLMAFVLGLFPGIQRGKTGVSIGDGGNPDLLLAMRRHANFVEWVPITLVMIAILELNGVGSTPLHCLGSALFVARVLHAVGLKGDTIQSMPRGIGAGLSTLVLIVASVWAITTAM